MSIDQILHRKIVLTSLMILLACGCGCGCGSGDRVFHVHVNNNYSHGIYFEHVPKGRELEPEDKEYVPAGKSVVMKTRHYFTSSEDFIIYDESNNIIKEFTLSDNDLWKHRKGGRYIFDVGP